MELQVRTRCLLALVLLCSSLVLLEPIPPAWGADGAALPTSPDGQVWVVNANVREQLTRDSSRHGDMRLFLRVAKKIAQGNAPDVVLLQQVNGASTRWLRAGFSKLTGSRFEIVEGPKRLKGSKPGEPGRAEVKGGFVRRDDSAILIDTSTMRVISSGKAVVSQNRSAARHLPMKQVVPWARIIETKAGSDAVEMTTTSIHYPTHRAFESRRQSYRHKARWSAQLNRFLNEKMPNHGTGDNKIPTLIGDFNATRCTEQTVYDCHRTALWKRMMKMGFREALFVAGWNRSIIDHIFNKGNMSEVYWDTATAGEFGGDGYSDHGVAAVLLEDEDRTPPTNEFLGGSIRSNGHVRLHGWKGLYGGWDGGTGLKHWALYRRFTPPDEWKLVGHTRDYQYFDNEVTISGSDTVQYRMTAVDRAGNRSEFMGPLTLPGE